MLKRNPYYKGDRPANPDQIVFTPNVNIDQSLLQVKAGQADLDIGGPPPTATADLGNQYGVNKGRFFVGPTSCVNYMGMNTARAPFNNVNLRKAVEYAIDRPAQVRLLGTYAGKRTEQILVPGIPGYKPFNAVSARRRQRRQGEAGRRRRDRSAPAINVVHTTSTYSTNRAQVAEFNLKQIGFKINDQPAPGDQLLPGGRDQGHVVQPDHERWLVRRLLRPVRLPERAVRRPQDPGCEQRQLHVLQQPVVQQGSRSRSVAVRQGARDAYAKLDEELMAKYAPFVPYLISTALLHVSRVKNWIYSSYFGEPYFNALSVG